MVREVFNAGARPKKTSGENGNHCGEDQNTQVESDFLRAGQGDRQYRQRGSASPGSEEQAKRRATHRENDALGEKLTDHAGSTGTECGTDGKFAGATG